VSLDFFYDYPSRDTGAKLEMIRVDLDGEKRRTGNKDKNTPKNAKGKEDQTNQLVPIEFPIHILDDMERIANKFHCCWVATTNDIASTKFEKFSMNVAKQYIVREEIYQETKIIVDGMMNANLHKLRTTNIEKLRNEASLKKDKKTRIKVNPLPGAVFAELKGMETPTMLKILVENKMVTNCKGDVDDSGESMLKHVTNERNLVRSSLTPQVCS
jgi:hypothetical protein